VYSTYFYNLASKLLKQYWDTIHSPLGSKLYPTLIIYPPIFGSMVHIAKLYNKRLIGFARENKFSYCDLASQITPSVDNFVDDCHFNLLGAKNVADFVSSCIVGFRGNS